MKKTQLPSGKALSIPELEIAIALAQTIYKDVATEDYIELLKQELNYKKGICGNHKNKPKNSKPI